MSESIWIDTKQKLPEHGVEVLVVSEDGIYATAEHRIRMGWCINGSWYFTPVYWMPIPELPMKEERS